MIDVTELVGTVFSGLSALVIEDVEDAGEVIVRAGEDPGRGGGLPGLRHGNGRACTGITSGRRRTCPSTAAVSW